MNLLLVSISNIKHVFVDFILAVCEGLLGICGVSDRKLLVVMNEGWKCLKDMFSKYLEIILYIR